MACTFKILRDATSTEVIPSYTPINSVGERLFPSVFVNKASVMDLNMRHSDFVLQKTELLVYALRPGGSSPQLLAKCSQDPKEGPFHARRRIPL